jgi:hypothetical protein
MRRQSTPPSDEIRVACPRLGHLVPFSYCRRESDELPCHKAIDCWYEHFLVEDYFREVLDPEAWEEAFERGPKDRMRRLMEIIEENRA